MIRYSIILTCVLSVLQSGLLADEITTASKERAMELEQNATIRPEAGGRKLSVSLGDYLPGSELHVRLRIHNETPRDQEFSSIKANCNCLSISPQRGEIPSGGNQVFDLKIKVKKNPGSIDQNAGFVAMNNGRPAFYATASYRLSGVVGFPDTSVSALIPESRGSELLKIPFFADASTPADFIEVQLSETLSHLPMKVNHQTQVIELMVSKEALDEGVLHGDISITNIETGVSDTQLISASVQSDFQVVPKSVRFRKIDEDQWGARVLLIDRSVGDGVTTKATCDFSFLGNLLSAKEVRRTGRVVQYLIRTGNPEVSSGENSISAFIRYGSRNTKLIVRTKPKL
ncbi:MAG: hypothetical protein AAF802_17905 [Planctomycetota bacterium]